MKILGLGKITKIDGAADDREYIVSVSEDEIDKITGVFGKTHIKGRYKPEMQIPISSI